MRGREAGPGRHSVDVVRIIDLRVIAVVLEALAALHLLASCERDNDGMTTAGFDDVDGNRQTTAIVDVGEKRRLQQQRMM